MDKEMEQFGRDLFESVRQMKKKPFARVTHVNLRPAAMARANMGLSQSEFAHLLGVSARTLQDWEQGRREPAGAARTLLKVAVKHPEVLKKLAA
jgi:putative transcriptional regulator